MQANSTFKTTLLICVLFAVALHIMIRAGHAGEGAVPSKLNVLLITADDMNYDSPGFTGCRVPDITPNLDRLATEGMWFQQAHVTVAVCQPSRECIMTGRLSLIHI